MSPSALSYYCCPVCRSPGLDVTGATTEGPDQSIWAGQLICRQCAASFVVAHGIPRFVGDEGYAGSFGFQWNRFRKTQLDSYTGLALSEDRLFLVTQWPRTMKNCVVLEAGSGAGRFTEVLLKSGATVFSFDLSNAVDANAANNAHDANLNLFQASIYNIPLLEGIFDRVLCLGVLQHTPDPARSFGSLVRYLKPGGEIAVDVYARNLRSLLQWKYVLRPITTRMRKDRLFKLVECAVRILLPFAILMRRFGPWAGRLIPILQYSHWGLPLELNREWALLDTFDMYSPAHDHPRSLAQVRQWLESAGLENVVVTYGPNGVIARGRRPFPN
ncbi:MAG TPA: class I SAM-dependent methyltransferase [Candidatus Sulfotelmatobacter sp.]|nr:class I SAM-dependent methyltransferase [Candidatus Sulfotelmatobacter sp.]